MKIEQRVEFARWSAGGHRARMLPGALGLKRRILRIGGSNKAAKAIINTID
jgi:hypothetical protein